jgi:two-component system cell cycle response regulator DivK
MSAGSDRLVLIVEDNERNLKLTRDLLQFHGYRTLEAATGEEGVALALQHRPDLVLMDIALPGIDGVEAARRIRADGSTEGIPVVAVTASVMQADRARLAEAGFVGVIAKPIDVLAFPDQVAGYLTPRGAA